MCLDTVGRVVATDGQMARVAFDGIERDISCVLLAADGVPVAPGDWLLTHTGLAVQRLDADTAEQMVDQMRTMRDSEVTP